MAKPEYDIEYYLDTASQLAERAGEHADQIDRDRQLPLDLAAEFADKGFFRLLRPKSLGG